MMGVAVVTMPDGIVSGPDNCLPKKSVFKVTLGVVARGPGSKSANYTGDTAWSTIGAPFPEAVDANAHPREATLAGRP